MKGLKALALRMVARSGLKGFEKMKAEAQDILLLLDDRNKFDVKPDVDEALVRKEDYEVVEKVKEDVDNVQLSEIKENDENCDKLKETEEVILIKCEDKLNETPVVEGEDEETLGIPSATDPHPSGKNIPEDAESLWELS